MSLSIALGHMRNRIAKRRGLPCPCGRDQRRKANRQVRIDRVAERARTAQAIFEIAARSPWARRAAVELQTWLDAHPER